MKNEWQFIIQLPVTQDILFDIRSMAGVKDVYGEGALLTIIPNKETRFEALHKWLSCYLREKHEILNRLRN